MITPDIVIIGAPKCGTTSIFNWLAEHPGICASNMKETYFFMDKKSILWKKGAIHYDESGISAYGSLFPECGIKDIRYLEATPDYLYQVTARKIFAELDKPPNILIILRKPSERVYSAFKFFKGTLGILNNNITFRQFIDEVLYRSDSKMVNSHQLIRQVINYTRYVNYIEEWYGDFSKKQIDIFLFEKLSDSPQSFMIELAQNLGIDETFYNNYDFKVYNRSISVRSQYLNKLKDVLIEIIPSGVIKNVLRNSYRSLNIKADSKKDRDVTETLMLLDDYFYNDNKRLSEIIGVDLSVWY